MPVFFAGIVCAGALARPATASPIAPEVGVLRAADAARRTFGSGREIVGYHLDRQTVTAVAPARDVPEPASRLLLVTSLLILTVYGAWFSTARPSDDD